VLATRPATQQTYCIVGLTLTMKISVELGLVRRAAGSSFHSLATSSPRQALTCPDLQHCD
jgi:hypothetical protein